MSPPVMTPSAVTSKLIGSYWFFWSLALIHSSQN